MLCCQLSLKFRPFICDVTASDLIRSGAARLHANHGSHHTNIHLTYTKNIAATSKIFSTDVPNGSVLETILHYSTLKMKIYLERVVIYEIEQFFLIPLDVYDNALISKDILY